MVATLVSTLIGTFTTSMNLHDKIQDKRNQAKQKETDEGQDKQIQDLKNEVERLQSKGDGGSQASGRSRSRRRKSIASSAHNDSDSDDYDRQVQRSQRDIQREFDQNYQQLGDRYAEGDAVTENRLKDQIISMQQTVIDVLQDALYNGRSLSKADIQRLVAAQDQAKQGSLEAMRDQARRMGRRSSHWEIDTRRQLTLPTPDSPMDDGFPQPRRVRTEPTTYDLPPALYCRYAYDLQTDQSVEIHRNFLPQSSLKCPACRAYVGVSTQNGWVLETRTLLPASQQDERGGLTELRKYRMDARLVLKSHTPEGDFACFMCYQDRTRDADCHCKTVDALVKHIGRDHTRDDLEREVDIWRDRNSRD